MRIIHISTIKHHPCFSDVVCMQSRTHEVIFVLLTPESSSRYAVLSNYREDGVEFIHLSVPIDIDFADDPALEAAFREILISRRPDIIHVQLFSGVNVRAVFRAGTGLPVRKFLTLHTHNLFCLPGVCYNEGEVCPLNIIEDCACQSCRAQATNAGTLLADYNRLRKIRMQEIISLSDAVICCSQWQRDAIRRLSGMHEKTMVLHYGFNAFDHESVRYMLTREQAEAAGIQWREFVDRVVSSGWGEIDGVDRVGLIEATDKDGLTVNEFFGKALDKLAAIVTPETRLEKVVKKASPLAVFGYIGTLWELKGIGILLDAARRIDKLDFELLLGVKCDFSDKKDAAFIARLQSSPRVKLVTNLERKELYGKFFSQIDYLVIPSVWEETGPMTLFEAFYHMIPVIVSNRPSITEKINAGVNALVFSDAASLSGIMQDLIEGRLKYAERSRENFPVKTFEEYAVLLDGIYQGGKPAAP